MSQVLEFQQLTTSGRFTFFLHKHDINLDNHHDKLIYYAGGVDISYICEYRYNTSPLDKISQGVRIDYTPRLRKDSSDNQILVISIFQFFLANLLRG